MDEPAPPPAPPPSPLRRLFRRPSGAWRLPWKLGAFVAGVVGLGIGFDQLLILVTGKHPAPVVPFGISDVALVVIVTLVALILERRDLASAGLAPTPRSPFHFALGTFLGVIAVAVAVAPIFASADVRLVGSPGALHAIGNALGVAAFEEILFRGWAFRRTVEALGVWPTQLLFAAGFAAPHLIRRPFDSISTSLFVVNLILVAMVFGFACLESGSVALPIGLHWGWNAMLGPILGLEVSGHLGPHLLDVDLTHAPRLLTGGNLGPEASITTTVVLSLGLYLLLARRRRRTDRVPPVSSTARDV